MNRKIRKILNGVRKIVTYLRERLSEPSTAVGLAVLLSAIYNLPSMVDQMAFCIELFVGFLGLISMLLPEKSKRKERNNQAE